MLRLAKSRRFEVNEGAIAFKQERRKRITTGTGEGANEMDGLGNKKRLQEWGPKISWANQLQFACELKSKRL
jgi:hypothetical protein